MELNILADRVECEGKRAAKGKLDAFGPSSWGDVGALDRDGGQAGRAGAG